MADLVDIPKATLGHEWWPSLRALFRQNSIPADYFLQMDGKISMALRSIPSKLYEGQIGL